MGAEDIRLHAEGDGAGAPGFCTRWHSIDFASPTSIKNLIRQVDRASGAGYSPMPFLNEFRRKGDGIEAVSGGANCLFADMDGFSPLRPLGTLPSTLIQRTSLAKDGTPKLHLLLRCAGGTTEKDRERMQRLWSAFWGGDPAVCDAARAVRCAGFYHRKSTPTLVKVLQADTTQEVSLKELEALLVDAGAGDLVRLSTEEIKTRYKAAYSARSLGVVGDDALVGIGAPNGAAVAAKQTAYGKYHAAHKIRYKDYGNPPALIAFSPSISSEFWRVWQGRMALESYTHLYLQRYGKVGDAANIDPTDHTNEAAVGILRELNAWTRQIKKQIDAVWTEFGRQCTTVEIQDNGKYGIKYVSAAQKAEGKRLAQEQINALEIGPFDLTQTYSSTYDAIEEEEAAGELGDDVVIALGDGSSLTVRELRALAKAGDTSYADVSCFCPAPHHDNQHTPAARLHALPHGVVVHCWGAECDCTYHSAHTRTQPLRRQDLVGFDWVGVERVGVERVGGDTPTTPSKYLQVPVIKPGTKGVVLVSPTGSGKSTVSGALIDAHQRAVRVVPTQALSISGAADISGISHKNQPKGDLEHDRVSITVDSLYRVPTTDPDKLTEFDVPEKRGGVLHVDEWSQSEKRLYTDKVLAEKIHKTRGTLVQHGEAADLLICSDAHLTAPQIRRWCRLHGLQPEQVQIVTLPPGAPSAHHGRAMTRYERPEQVVQRALDLLESGEKVALYTSKKVDVEAYGKLFRDKFPEKEGVLIHSECSAEDENSLREVNTEWANKDYVIYNGRCGSGVSYDPKGDPDANEFHSLMIATHVPGISYMDLLQAAHRIRHPKSWGGWIHDVDGVYPRTPEQIINGYERLRNKHYDAWLCRTSAMPDFVASAEQPQRPVGDPNSPLCRDGAEVVSELEEGCYKVRAKFWQSLKEQGARLSYVPAPPPVAIPVAEAINDPLNPLGFKILKDEIKEEKALRAQGSSPLTGEELERASRDLDGKHAAQRRREDAARTLERFGAAAVEDGEIRLDLIKDTQGGGKEYAAARARVELALLCSGGEALLDRAEERIVGGGDLHSLARKAPAARAGIVRDVCAHLGIQVGVEGLEEGLVHAALSQSPKRELKAACTDPPPTLTIKGSGGTWGASEAAHPTLIQIYHRAAALGDLFGGLRPLIANQQWCKCLNLILRQGGIPIKSRQKGPRTARVYTYSLHTDAVDKAIHRSERHLHKLLGLAVPAIEELDPRANEFSLELAELVEESKGAWQPYVAPPVAAVLEPVIEPDPTPDTTWEEPQTMYRIACFQGGGEARMALRSRSLGDALARFTAQAEALGEAEGVSLIGWRPPTPEEADEIYEGLPEEFWASAA